MSKHLVVVESPAKAKTIENYLGKDYEVLACFGHVRDLPSDNMGVDLTTFDPEYTILSDKKKLITELKKKAKQVDYVWLATDPDREGEAIAWHVQEALGLPEDKYKRIVFNEITKTAVLSAIETPRALDHDLVNAQQARRILDRVVGYEMSPILWKKLRRGLSAGRVQSVAVRIIVEKEVEIEAFKIGSSFKVTAQFSAEGTAFEAELNQTFDTEEAVTQWLNELGDTFSIQSIEQKESTRSPRAPFTTSSLQQEASSRLGYSVSRTMTLAQRLYEAGHITYMRTDGTTLSNDAKTAIAGFVSQQYGANYVQARDYQTKVKGAQEAHEAIRPTNVNTKLAGKDDGEERLYKLIWQRTVASQMASAKLLKTTISIPSDPYIFEAKGEVVSFDGFFRVYPTSDKDKHLPNVTEGTELICGDVLARQKFTRPPARFTEASLVKKLEELGIGRPSTFAPTITTIQKREYVERIESEGKQRDVIIVERVNSIVSARTEQEGYGNDNGKLQPTDIGILVTNYLTLHFDRVMNYQFTADIEAEFDAIGDNTLNWQEMLKRFYKSFHPKIEAAEADDQRINEERNLGADPKTGKTIYAKIGRYGPFVQLGETDDEDKRSVSLKKGMKYSNIELDDALSCLEYPMELGEYKGAMVTLNIGRYGIYLKHDDKNYSIKDVNVERLDDAIDIIDATIKERANRDIQQYEHDGDTINVLNGRFGPYVTYKKKNFKIPKDKDAAKLTLDECIEIINQPPSKKRRRKSKK
jgi:DNA topoisomerase I